MSLIINLFGGPGTGKSTSAAYLYSLLKQNGHSAELIREYVKDWAWEGRKISLYDQYYFIGKQIRLESMLFNKVDYIITDCPVRMIGYYTQKYAPAISKDIYRLIDCYEEQAYKDGHTHKNIFLHRSKAYKTEGRYQSEDEAIAMDTEILNILPSYRGYNTNTGSLELLYKDIIKKYD